MGNTTRKIRRFKCPAAKHSTPENKTNKQPFFRPRKPAQKKKKLSADNVAFFKSVDTFVKGQKEIYNNKLVNLRKKYKAKNWAIDENKGNFKTYKERLKELDTITIAFATIKTLAASKGDDLLRLANIVYNEAGNVSGLVGHEKDAAQSAIAYAYMNRTGGKVPKPTRGDISHYKALKNRWEGFNTDEKYEFLNKFPSAVTAAKGRLDVSGTDFYDPTYGATHWVSPVGLKEKSPYDGTERYQRTYQGMTRSYPNWARSETWVNDKKNAKQAKKWFDVKNFKEMKACDVGLKYFTFYKGVNYKK